MPLRYLLLAIRYYAAAELSTVEYLICWYDADDHFDADDWCFRFHYFDITVAAAFAISAFAFAFFRHDDDADAAIFAADAVMLLLFATLPLLLIFADAVIFLIFSRDSTAR